MYLHLHSLDLVQFYPTQEFQSLGANAHSLLVSMGTHRRQICWWTASYKLIPWWRFKASADKNMKPIHSALYDLHTDWYLNASLHMHAQKIVQTSTN